MKLELLPSPSLQSGNDCLAKKLHLIGFSNELLNYWISIQHVVEKLALHSPHTVVEWCEYIKWASLWASDQLGLSRPLPLVAASLQFIYPTIMNAFSAFCLVSNSAQQLWCIWNRMQYPSRVCDLTMSSNLRDQIMMVRMVVIYFRNPGNILASLIDMAYRR